MEREVRKGMAGNSRSREAESVSLCSQYSSSPIFLDWFDKINIKPKEIPRIAAPILKVLASHRTQNGPHGYLSHSSKPPPGGSKLKLKQGHTAQPWEHLACWPLSFILFIPQSCSAAVYPMQYLEPHLMHCGGISLDKFKSRRACDHLHRYLTSLDRIQLPFLFSKKTLSKPEIEENNLTRIKTICSLTQQLFFSKNHSKCHTHWWNLRAAAPTLPVRTLFQEMLHSNVWKKKVSGQSVEHMLLNLEHRQGILASNFLIIAEVKKHVCLCLTQRRLNNKIKLFLHKTISILQRSVLQMSVLATALKSSYSR